MVRPAVPATDVRRRVEAIVGATDSWQPVTGGYSAAGIWVVGRPGATNVFVKAATTEPTARFLRDEYAVYAGIAAECIPDLVGWDGDGEYPVLVIQDLSGGRWPPPWDRDGIDSVWIALNELASLPGPWWLPALEGMRDQLTCWRTIAADPKAFIAGGLAGDRWLDVALPKLLAGETMAPVGGDAVLHLDVRSDNVCFTPAAKLVDWNWARRGNPEVDVIAWLPSLYLEGGPAPWVLRPAADWQLVALFAGYFAHHAGLPPTPNVNPDVRALQHRQADVCLEWLAQIDPTFVRT